MRRGAISLCLLIGVVWLALMVQGEQHGLWALVTLSIFGAAAFIGGASVSALPTRARLIAHVDAATAGAMLAAALVLVIPHAVVRHAGVGVIGLLIGLAIGAVLHYGAAGNGHGSTGAQSTLAALTLHSLFAGIALGALYSLVPALSWAVGVAILAHKAPAGYVLARRLQASASNTVLVLLPALATGLGALSVAIIRFDVDFPAGLVFGAAAGLFVFVAVAFVASHAVVRRQSGAEWMAFAIGAIAIALVGWMVPHSV